MTELADEQGNGLSIRDHVESAYASSTVSPDIDSAVSGAVEQRDRESRDRSRGKGGLDREGQAAETRRAQIRDAVTNAKQTAATGGSAKPVAGEVPAGPPPNWDQGAKAAWNDLPQEVRLAELRQHAELKPHFERLAAFDDVLAPHREIYRQHGIESDAQAIKQLFSWEAALRNPTTRAQAFRDLAAQYQVDPSDTFGGSQQSYQASPDHVQTAANREVSTFSAGKEHFETVRETMGQMLQRDGTRYVTASGGVNLDALYRDAVQSKGLSASRSAAPSQAPAGQRGTGKTVRQNILAAVREVTRGAA